MKRWITGLLMTLMMILALVGCGGGSQPAPFTKEQAQEILDSGAFTDQLEELDCDIAYALYGLEGAGLNREQLTDGVVRRSAGATCEELALLFFDSSDSASKAKAALEDYRNSQIESNRDYRPAEIPKLESALLEQRDNSLLLVVSADNAAVEGQMK